ncbi:beta-ketoacyl synthase chain length factor [Gallaecimonas kandeliae]|uniref:beta-ketoacyl synthase chain length factor n=1 Tax=Gallaecimonas kandeliae TaxID=3029055 RepID=UPI00264801F6|nr:beta-ketoacyl synthase chain length factor [Gallaecimonas kandeliae]WKE64003.1 beta-ketoacyl synthase chain length factor [Gallaecimonas kandeliae]
MSLRFAVKAWSAWAPGLANADEWRHWRRSGELAEEKPVDLSWVPAGQRRRLSALTRIQLACAHQVLGEDSLPTVFATRHGELHRTVQLLGDLGIEEPLSPTAFSLSVHNAAAGLLNILRGDQAPSTVVVAGDDSLVLGLVEACGLLGSGVEEVVLVVADQAVPVLYEGAMANRQCDHALALRLAKGEQFSLDGGASCQDDCPAWPLAMQLAALLATDESGELRLAGRRWQWARA